MAGNLSTGAKSAEIASLLQEYEQFCLGQKHMTPEAFMEINEELSINAVLKIGKSRIEKLPDGSHLIWEAPDKTEHDLGSIENVNVTRDYPGFHRTRSLSLGQQHVKENDVVHVPATDRNISVVRLVDGTTGYGPNYKLALRNAALKMHLKNEFSKANPLNLWKFFYANA